MKKHISILVVTIISVFAIAACSLSDAKLSSNNSTTTNNSENKSNAAKTETNSSSASSTSSTAGDIAGSYTVSGTNPSGKPYQGEMTVTKRDSVYQFSWKAGAEYDGVGIQSGNAVAVAYTTGKDGRGCGAVIYDISADGALRGKWGEWGVNQSGTETGVQTAGNGFIGGFEISGSNPNGSPYKGRLLIKKDTNELYQLAWNAGKMYVGTGIKLGNYLAAGSGDKRCGFVIYEVNGNNLEGKWGVPGATTLGTEKATRK